MSQRSGRFLSYVLRHRPEEIGLEVDRSGWADVSTLLRLLRKSGRHIEPADLDRIVQEDEKGRFTFSPDRRKIRAAQGHSFPVDLSLQASTPPPTLFHGTATSSLDSIFQNGLIPGRRQHVHLSSDLATATKVGARHGNPVVLQIDCEAMVRDGHSFLVADNGVWLVDAVPRAFLSFAPAGVDALETPPSSNHLG